MRQFLILGCGYTGRRVAKLLTESGARVTCSNRDGSPVPGASVIALDATQPTGFAPLRPYVSRGTAVLHSIPLISTGSALSDITPALVEFLKQNSPARVVYLSTTGIYGTHATFVDEHTPAAPESERELLRVQAEQAVAAGPWSSLVLRPAAIYGPGRGVHASMQSGVFRLPEANAGVISRIHVDDLARHCFAALLGNVTGAFPVADEEPCTSREVAEFTARLLNLPLPPPVPASSLSVTQRANRRVDGAAIRRALKIGLLYPSFRQGIPASLATAAGTI